MDDLRKDAALAGGNPKMNLAYQTEIYSTDAVSSVQGGNHD